MSFVTPARAVLVGFVLLVSASGCEGAPPPDVTLDGGPPTRAFGQTCASTEDCESGLCLTIERGRAVCTRVCSGDADCPASGSWGCVSPEGFPARVCGCVPDAGEEVCGDGLDNECNGRVDDCRTCGGVPVPEDDPRHCGACGNACRSDQECSGGTCRCPPGETDCGGRCVDLQTDRDQCGACGEPCPTGAACAGGACVCPASAPDACGTRCTDVRTDSANCGECGNLCPAGLACEAGGCNCADPVWSLYCDGTGCVDPESDERHCGGCGVACAAGQECLAGDCVCPMPGTTFCEGRGCIDLRRDATSCGACGRACAPGERCELGACVCDSGVTCGGACVPVADPTNCGACGVSCRADQRCDGTSCICTWPTVECGGACIDTRYDRANCGACGNVCPAAQMCDNGACRCVSGLTFCAATGTCVDLWSDESSCGACGNTCPAAQTCVSGTCRCPTTGDTYCAASGVCARLTTDSSNCGACGNVCPAGTTCQSGSCRCPIAGQTYCPDSGSCVDLGTDEASCGTCGNVCASATTCQSGTCRCPASGQIYCASVDACVDYLGDELHCGACDRVCPAATSCRSGACACDVAGLSLCGATCVDRQTDEANCGTCGAACGAGRECIAGSCHCPAPVTGSLVRRTTSASTSYDVRVASDGDRVAIVWTEQVSSGTTGNSVRFALLESDGTLVAGTETALAADNYVGSPDVVWNGSEYGVVWYQRVGTYRAGMFRRFGADGAPLAAAVDVTAGSQGTYGDVMQVRITWAAGSGYGMLIQGSTGYVRFQLLGTDASMLPLAVPMPEYSSSGASYDIAGATDGRFALLHGNRVQPLNGDGSITVPSIVLASDVVSPTLAWDGEGWVVLATRIVYPSGPRPQVVLLRGPTLSTAHVVYQGPGSTVVLRDSGMAIRDGIAEIVWTEDNDGSGSRRLQIARVRMPVSGASFSVVSPPVSLMSDYTVAPQRAPVTTFVAPDEIVTAWPDTRWGQEEIYVLAATVGTCR